MYTCPECRKPIKTNAHRCDFCGWVTSIFKVKERMSIACPNCNNSRPFGAIKCEFCEWEHGVLNKKLYQKRIKKFMWKKAIKLRCLPYSHTLIMRDIMTWSDEDAKRVWSSLLDNVKYQGLCDVGGGTCPYCIKGYYTEGVEECIESKCFWGDVNGYCTDEKDELNGLYEKLKHRDIPNHWYKDLIHEIEKTR